MIPSYTVYRFRLLSAATVNLSPLKVHHNGRTMHSLTRRYLIYSSREKQDILNNTLNCNSTIQPGSCTYSTSPPTIVILLADKGRCLVDFHF